MFNFIYISNDGMRSNQLIEFYQTALFIFIKAQCES